MSWECSWSFLDITMGWGLHLFFNELLTLTSLAYCLKFSIQFSRTFAISGESFWSHNPSSLSDVKILTVFDDRSKKGKYIIFIECYIGNKICMRNKKKWNEETHLNRATSVFIHTHTYSRHQDRKFWEDLANFH